LQAPDGPQRIQCDRHQLGQALTNTLKNAYEAIEVKSQSADVDYRGKILVDVQADDEAVTVSVQDNGIGLPQDRVNILEPYVTTREKGTGLGLAIVNKIVEEHGGEMTFTSVETGGTCVIMRFARDPLAETGAAQKNNQREG
tara:strand:+ start:1421 stop:1846 length:426 start_codon:yes stop_codon:yes gene_type:complete